MASILYCFCKFYNSILIIEKFKSGKFTKLKMLLNSIFFLKSNNQIDQINFRQFWNSIYHIVLVIFEYLLSMNRIATLQSIIRIDCNPNTETFSTLKWCDNHKGMIPSLLGCFVGRKGEGWYHFFCLNYVMIHHLAFWHSRQIISYQG
jgi:hypothetical protein